MNELTQRVEVDRTRLDRLRIEAQTNLKASILCRLVEGVSERYALKKPMNKKEV